MLRLFLPSHIVAAKSLPGGPSVTRNIRVLPAAVGLLLALACTKAEQTPTGPDGPSTLTISTTALSDGTQGQAYSATLAASGGEGGYTWSISAGTLPSGLTLSASSGSISGAPTDVQSAAFAVDVASGDGHVANRALTIDVHDDDVAAFSITESAGATIVGESGSTDDFSDVLLAQPLANVVLDVTVQDAGEATVSPASLTFTNADWSTAVRGAREQD